MAVRSNKGCFVSFVSFLHCSCRCHFIAPSSGNNTAITFMNSQQMSAPSQVLHELKLSKLLAWIGKETHPWLRSYWPLVDSKGRRIILPWEYRHWQVSHTPADDGPIPMHPWATLHGLGRLLNKKNSISNKMRRWWWSWEMDMGEDVGKLEGVRGMGTIIVLCLHKWNSQRINF